MKWLSLICTLSLTLLVSCGEEKKNGIKKADQQTVTKKQPVTVSCTCRRGLATGFINNQPVKGTGTSENEAKENANKICKDTIYKGYSTAYVDCETESDPTTAPVT